MAQGVFVKINTEAVPKYVMFQINSLPVFGIKAIEGSTFSLLCPEYHYEALRPLSERVYCGIAEETDSPKEYRRMLRAYVRAVRRAETIVKRLGD